MPRTAERADPPVKPRRRRRHRAPVAAPAVEAAAPTEEPAPMRGKAVDAPDEETEE